METKRKSGTTSAKGEMKSSTGANAPVAENGIDFGQFRFDGENIHFFDHRQGYFKKIPKQLELMTLQRLSCNTLSLRQLRKTAEELKLTPDIY